MKKVGNSLIVNISLLPHQLERIDKWCYRLKMKRSEFLRKAAVYYIQQIKADKRIKNLREEELSDEG